MLRAILTILIIAVGITALIGILTAIDVAIYSLSDNFTSLGANSFVLYPKGDGAKGNRKGRRAKRGEPISFKQAMDFKERFDFPAEVSVNMSGTRNATIKHGKEKTNPNVLVRGIDEQYFEINGLELTEGRNFSSHEVMNGNHSAIIGMDIVNSLFDEKAEVALNKMISVGNIKYKVIGVLITIYLLLLEKRKISQEQNRAVSVCLEIFEDYA